MLYSLYDFPSDSYTRALFSAAFYYLVMRRMLVCVVDCITGIYLTYTKDDKKGSNDESVAPRSNDEPEIGR
jgi:hypothetical protein